MVGYRLCNLGSAVRLLEFSAHCPPHFRLLEPLDPLTNYLRLLTVQYSGAHDHSPRSGRVPVPPISADQFPALGRRAASGTAQRLE